MANASTVFPGQVQFNTVSLVGGVEPFGNKAHLTAQSVTYNTWTFDTSSLTTIGDSDSSSAAEANIRCNAIIRELVNKGIFARG